MIDTVKENEFVNEARPQGTPDAHKAASVAASPLIDVKEFATKLACSTKHVRRLADAGRCPPPIRLGGLRRWNRKTVDDWIAAGCPVVRHIRSATRK